MFTSIMVGQDASDQSRRALDLAIWFAAATNARLNLIHLHSRKPRVHPSKSVAEMEVWMHERLVECREAGVRCSWRVVEGWSTQTLINEAKWYDLIVVGKRGANVARHASGVGSLANALLSSSPVPVLIADEHRAIPESLLVVFDESPDACTALRIATALASERGLALFVVDAGGGRGRENRLERAAEYVEECGGVEAEYESLAGRPIDSVPAYIEKRNIRLTFLPALDRSFFGHKLANRIASRSVSSLVVPRGHTPPVY